MPSQLIRKITGRFGKELPISCTILTPSRYSLRFILVLLSCFSIHLVLYSQSRDNRNGWYAFASVEFQQTPMEDGTNYLLVPQFNDRVTALEGQKVQLRGYVLPFDHDDNSLIILSRYPYNNCFFCGAAGPESVAEIHFPNTPPEFKLDERVTIVGYLRLNDRDPNQMNFILEACQIVENN